VYIGMCTVNKRYVSFNRDVHYECVDVYLHLHHKERHVVNMGADQRR